MTFKGERGIIQGDFPRELGGFSVFSGLTGSKSAELIRLGAIAISTAQCSDVNDTESDFVSLGAKTLHGRNYCCRIPSGSYSYKWKNINF